MTCKGEIVMLFAIKYNANRRGLKIANKSLNRFGSAIMFRGDDTGVFFTNPIIALKIAHKLNSSNKNLRYSVYKLSQVDENNVDKSLVVSTMEEYQTLSRKHEDELWKKIKEMQMNNNCEDKYSEEDELQL